jgi:hypothetical protein
VVGPVLQVLSQSSDLTPVRSRLISSDSDAKCEVRKEKFLWMMETMRAIHIPKLKNPVRLLLP